MKAIKTYILILISLLFFACNHGNVEKSITIPTPPVATKSVQPQLIKVKDNIDKSIVDTSKIKGNADDQTKIIAEQKQKIQEALALAEKLKASKNVTEKELNDLNSKLLEIRALNGMLVSKNDDLTKTIKALSDLLATTKTEANQTLTELQAKESETNELRNQNKFLANNLLQRNKDVEELQDVNNKLTKKAASSGVYKNWIIGIVSAFVLWTIVKNILMVYFPTTKFRI